MRIRTVLFAVGGVVGAAIGGAAIGAALEDPDVDVATIELGGITATGSAGSSGRVSVRSSANQAAGAQGRDGVITVQEVDGLEQLVGTLRSGEDPEDWYVSGVEVDFGPDGWISAAPAFEDYDGDGTIEALLDELRNLEGRTITLGVRFEVDDERDDADVFTIEGLGYRDPTGGPAPWQTGTTGVAATREQVAAAAAAAVGEGAVTLGVEREHDDGWKGWDVEVRSADGREYQVYLDLAGTVVDVRPDDD